MKMIGALKEKMKNPLKEVEEGHISNHQNHRPGLQLEEEIGRQQ